MIIEKKMKKSRNYDNKRFSKRIRRRIRRRRRGNNATFAAFIICFLLLGSNFSSSPPYYTVTVVYGQPGIAHQFLSHDGKKSTTTTTRNTQSRQEEDYDGQRHNQQDQKQDQEEEEEDFDSTCRTITTSTESSSSSSSDCCPSSSSSSTTTTNGSSGGSGTCSSTRSCSMDDDRRSNTCSSSCPACTDDTTTVASSESNTDESSSSSDSSFDKEEESTTSTSSTTTTPSEFFGIFSKLGTSWTNVLKLFVKAVGSAGGTTHRRDVYVDTIQDAMITIKDMINKEKKHKLQQQQQTSSTSRSSSSIWDFDTVPLQSFNKNIDDLYLAYIYWSIADTIPDDINKCNRPGSVNGISSSLLNLDENDDENDDDSSNSSSSSSSNKSKKKSNNKNKINVSKAFRRLQQYAEWMDDDDLRRTMSSSSSSTSSSSTIEEVYKLFQMQVTVDDCERIVWWLDLSKIDFNKLHLLDTADIKRYFVWVSHYMLFINDEEAQQNGIIFINSLGQISFWTFMTMLPLELGIKIDEFVISVLPLKTKFVVLLERPSWAKFAFSLLKPFLKNDMQKRMIVVEHGLYAIEYLEEIIGPTKQYAIPNFVDDLDGNPNIHNIMDEYYYYSLLNITDKNENKN